MYVYVYIFTYIYENAHCAQLILKEPMLVLVTSMEGCVCIFLNISLVNIIQFLNTWDLNEFS